MASLLNLKKLFTDLWLPNTRFTVAALATRIHSSAKHTWLYILDSLKFMKDNKKNERRQIDDMEVCAFKFEYPKRSPNLSEMVSLLKATQSRNENVYKFNFPRFKFQVKLKRKDKKKMHDTFALMM